MTTWTVPDGELITAPRLRSLLYDGKEVKGFLPGVKEYTVESPYGSVIPVISAEAVGGQVQITQPTEPGGIGFVTVTSENGRKTVYTIKFKLVHIIERDIRSDGPEVGMPQNVTLAEMKSCTASDEPQPENPAVNAADGNLATRWAANVKGSWLEVDLGETKPIDGVAMGFMAGTERSYFYRVLVSDDNITYKLVYDGRSTAKTSEWEYLPLRGISARYVRYVGDFNSASNWNSVTEFRPCVKNQ